MNGFTYNGIHSSEYNVYYIPDPAAQWWKESEFETYKKDVAWKHGGYWYGASANIREINLSCYFEEIDIATRERIRQWLGRNTSGILVLDERPFVYYKVRPANVVPGKMYLDTDESKSGTFTITFIAVDPFGYLTRKSNDGTEDDNAEDYCGIIPSEMMPPAPYAGDTSFSVYNPGTEPCGLKIMVAGSCSNPIRFFNNSNKTQCVISSLPAGGAILDLDGDTGMVKVYASGSPESYDNGFAYHDYGMVRLDPNTNDWNIQNYVDGEGVNIYNPNGNNILGRCDLKEALSLSNAEIDDQDKACASIVFSPESGSSYAEYSLKRLDIWSFNQLKRSLYTWKFAPKIPSAPPFCFKRDMYKYVLSGPMLYIKFKAYTESTTQQDINFYVYDINDSLISSGDDSITLYGGDEIRTYTLQIPVTEDVTLGKIKIEVNNNSTVDTTIRDMIVSINPITWDMYNRYEINATNISDIDTGAVIINGLRCAIIDRTPGTNSLVISTDGIHQIESTGQVMYADTNIITIEEKNSSGNWVTPTTLSLSYISIDYKPRLL